MKYYELYEKYKRSLYFFYNENNKISGFDYCTSKKIEDSEFLVYDVEVLDSYLSDYDYLPVASGLPLVSKRFREAFSGLEASQLEYFKAMIISKDGGVNTDFLSLNILNCYPGMDKEKSIFEINKYGILKIESLSLKPNFMKDHLIGRLEEKKSIVIVNQVFKDLCTRNKLKGMGFIEIE
ncbi:imm11 family protein [Myroides sp. LJL116]